MNFFKKIFPFLFFLSFQSYICVTPTSAMMIALESSQGFIFNKGLSRFKKVGAHPSHRFFSTQVDQSNQTRKTVRILSIDGGGIRGIIPLTILAHIEERTGKPIANLFDVISGTSTGGIIALGLNVPDPDKDGNPKRSASYLQNLYKNKNDQVFHQNFLLKSLRKVPLLSSAEPLISGTLNVFKSKYSHKELEKFLADEFSTSLISQAISTVIVPAYDIRLSKIHVFSNQRVNSERDEDFYMKDVARATSAAPTYFLPAKIYAVKHNFQSTNPYHLVDGGVSSNNPALIAYSHAQKLYPEADDFLIVSLGTGTRKIGFIRYDDLASNGWEWIRSGGIKGSGFWGWSRKLPGLMINAPSSATEHCLTTLGLKKYFRLQPDLPEELTSLDSTHHEKIGDLIAFGEKMITDTYRNDINKIIKELEKKREYAGANGILKVGVNLSNNIHD